jgi:RNA polymerase sigma-70 factor, ECF subfamily
VFSELTRTVLAALFVHEMVNRQASDPVDKDEHRPDDFEEFFKAEYRRLGKALYVLTDDAYEADDLAQEAFVRVFERWGTVRAMASPVGYLYRVALNLHRSRLRRLFARARWRRTQPQPSDPLLAVEAKDEVDRYLSRLSGGQREAVILVEWLGEPVEEAARTLGIKPGALRARLFRARGALREMEVQS